jgi:hypothetical protein
MVDLIYIAGFARITPRLTKPAYDLGERSDHFCHLVHPIRHPSENLAIVQGLNLDDADTVPNIFELSKQGSVEVAHKCAR